MHRWGQSQMFRSLAFYVFEDLRSERDKVFALQSRQSKAAAVKA
jgi:hypothetical protein